MSSANSNKLFLLLALTLGLMPVLLRPVNRQQELRVLIVARNMVDSGDWLHPQFQGQPRYRKPPLAYWTSAAAMTLAGQRHSATPPRLMNLLAACAMVLLLRDLARRHQISEKAAIVLLMGSFGFWRFAPLAETDLWLLLGVTGAYWSWDRNRGVTAGLFMAIGVLAKGPAAVAVPLLGFLILQIRDRHTLRFWLGAVLLPMIAGGSWIAFLRSDPIASAALQQELSDTFVRSPHAAPPWYYLYTLPKVFLPGSLLLFWFQKRPVPRLAGVWFGVAFALLCLTPSKQDHYTLLLLPPTVLCLLPCLPSTRNWAWERIGVAVALMFIGIELVALRVNPYAQDEKFLKEIRSEVADCKTLHTVGINSAIFDWNLGRHVENTDSVTKAWRQSETGDAVIAIQRFADQASEELSPPLHSSNGAVWARQLWRNQ